MKALSLNIKPLDGFVNEHEMEYMEPFVMAAHNMLHEKKGAGNDFLGWVDLPVGYYNQEEYIRIKDIAQKIQEQSDVLVVIGIGGSYLGARAAIEALTGSFYNLFPKNRRKTPEIYFAGHNISSTYLLDLLELIKDKEVSVNVISKSGTTTESAIAFRFLRDFLEKKYGRRAAKKRIFVTTDKKRGALRQLSEEEGYERFIIPDNIGGRYSVLTPVGLLPIAVAGIDIDAIFKGAMEAYNLYKKDFAQNDCYKYAAIRNILYQKQKTIEIMVNYEPALHFFTEWWKQLYGESEGKDGKGIFPAGVDFSTDLHSMGQYIQSGIRNLFETVINIETIKSTLIINEEEKDVDGINYLSGKTVDFVNKMAMQGTIMAHRDGGVPNMILSVPELSAYYFGQMIYFFEKACGISGYILGVNPFNQPGVENYKRNMFALLEKPGFEEESRKLKKRLF